MLTIPTELSVPLLGLAGAAVGYGLREWRNRVTPLFEVIGTDGGTTKRSETVTVPKEISDELKGSFYLGELQPESSLGDIYDCWNRCDDVKQLWPETKLAIEETIAARTDDEFLRNISEVLRYKKADDWLVRLLINGKLDFQLDHAVANGDEKVHFWFEDEREKCVWFDLPPNGRSFGNRMDHPAIRDKCMPFIIALSRMHRSGIAHALRQYISVFDVDHRKALACIHDLKKIDNENSQWAFYCYLANTGHSPLVVEKLAALTAVDGRTGTKHRHPCYLCLVDEKSFSLSDTRTPLIVSPGEGKVFALLTSDRQKDMNLGPALRELYERGDGKCHLSVVLRRSGLLRRQRYRTATAVFASSTRDK
jgi:hypothetical protein